MWRLSLVIVTRGSQRLLNMLGGGGWFSKMSSTKMWLCYSWTGSGGICINMDTALTDSKVTGEVYLFFFSFFLGGWGGWRWGWWVLWCLIILRIRSSLSLRNFNLFPGRTYSSPPRSLPSSLMVDEQRGRHSRLFWAFSEFILMLIVFGLHISTAKKNICPQYQPCTVHDTVATQKMVRCHHSALQGKKHVFNPAVISACAATWVGSRCD